MNATWYATTPPATPLPATSDAPSSNAAPECSSTPHTASRDSRDSAGSPRIQRGRNENPARRAATIRIADEREHAAGPGDREQHLLRDREVEASGRRRPSRGTRTCTR